MGHTNNLRQVTFNYLQDNQSNVTFLRILLNHWYRGISLLVQKPFASSAFSPTSQFPVNAMHFTRYFQLLLVFS